MNKRIHFLIALIIIPALVLATSARAETDGWSGIVSGIDYQEFAFNSPDPDYPGQVHAYVARMDRSNTSITLDSAIANGTIAGSRQKMSEMAALYNDAINYWGQTWGARNNVVVAINGGFFDLNSGVIFGGQIQGGWYVKRFGNYGGGGGGGGSGFAWKIDRQAFMGQCINHISDRQRISFQQDLNNWMKFDGINLNPANRGLNQLIIYTPQYGATTPVNNEVTLTVVVELASPKLIKPLTNYVAGTVREIRDGNGVNYIPYNSVVLSAGGTARNILLEHKNIQVNDVIWISQELSHYSITDCTTPVAGDWTKTYASIDGNKLLVMNGVVPTTLPVLGPDPRTAIAMNANYIYFIVVDGRQPGYSIGLDLKYLGQFALNTLGATWAINEDGGGSSTMVINGNVVNTPSDGCNALWLPYISTKSNTIEEPSDPAVEAVDLTPLLVKCERTVANGMLMVQVLPAEQSTTFAPGEAVITNQAAVLRLGPGSNYARITTISSNTAGTILADNNNLNGIWAKGYYRWKVDFGGGRIGWVAEETLLPNAAQVALENQ
jgi:hypothetical protein